MSKIYDEIKESEQYKKIAKEMSDDEKQLTDIAMLNLIKEFEEKFLKKLEKLKNLKTDK